MNAGSLQIAVVPEPWEAARRELPEGAQRWSLLVIAAALAVAVVRRMVERRRARREAAAAPPPPRGPAYARAQGEWGERQAEEYLVHKLEPPRKRLRTVGRRVRVGRDEIDLVMEPADARYRPMTVFVEVKTRTDDSFGGGLGAIDRRKRHAMCRAAARYMARRPASPFRIDVVEVFGVSDGGGRADRILHFENAVPMERRFTIQGLHR